MNEFIVAIHALGRFPEIKITEEEYIEIKRSKLILKNFFEIENLYEILITNYYNFEKESLVISLDQMLLNEFNYKIAYEQRMRINRVIMNLLSSLRSYIDQSPKCIASCFDNDIQIENKEKKRFLDKRKSDFNFGFVESLRNHVQHNGLPIHLFTSHSKWTDDFENMEFWNSFSVKKEYIVCDIKFNKQIIDKMPEKIDILDSIRRYISDLSFLHDEIRHDYAHFVSNSRALLGGYIEEYIKKSNGQSIGLTAMRKSEGKFVDPVPIILEWDNVREELEKKHTPLANLTKRCVTNRR
ncbi:hypothetical protein [Desulfocurvus sp. DL9XJH121]